jgi:DNA polymerase-3 subunit epsilon
MVKDKPRFEEVANEIGAALRGCVPSAYNALFDRAFMQGEFARAKAETTGIPAMSRETEWIDPLVWAREVQSDEKSRALGDVAARLGVKLEQAHRASDDAEAALRVMYALGKDVRIPRAYGALVQEQRRLSQAQADQRRMWRS